ncbi:RNA-directed DNA polymerase (reverse transcriptase) [Tasmannia lanceolata]|uniref:RNA-directed DNA polymerase (reverse transcriptase) n=1 Tax=Tasmannia lanceolata TaxID=3420 RepID=UPI004063107E
MLLNLMRIISSSDVRVRVCISTSLRFHSNTPPPAFLNLPPHTSNPTKTPNRTDLETLILKQYSLGKFHNLLQNVISNPNVLLTACQNLIPSKKSDNVAFNSISDLFSIEKIALELKENKFNVESYCVRMIPSRKKGESLIIPNLTLKVVIEAVRMVLEIIYDKRFVTFSYGGRVGMGRHTAIRYLKMSVINPNWWFRVVFCPKPFDFKHICKLALIIEEKIDDRILIDLIKRLFEFDAVRIGFGGCSFERGFPQETSLNSILTNIYFNGFDREIQDFRLEIDSRSPKFDSEDMPSRVFYKPVRVYAVRYLDEILVISSGSKMLTMDLKNRVVEFLERNLELKVDRLLTSVHSAVSEKIDFLGMELQAVPPMVLHPPMSDKAIRAQKKYIIRKEAKALELRNARETIRKKLGLKILNHVFKKLKRCEGFKFELSVETEVRDIFRTWAEEVVHEFFGSSEECWNWHRALSSGDFLSLRAIRDQLPQELVDSYDQFQEKVEKYMKPERASKVLDEEDRQIEEEKRRYAERTVEDLTELCMKVTAPMELVRKAVKMAGFTNSMGRPRPIKLLIPLEDSDIIKWYAGVGRRWLEFFCCCRNFKMVKTIVNYHLRFSCILTLAEKHESTKREAIRHYTKDLKVIDTNGEHEICFPTEREIKMMGDKNLSDPKPVDGVLSMALVRLACNEPSGRCVAHFCDKTDTVLYRVRLLQNRLNVNPLDPKKWVLGMGAIHESLNRKCLPLCSKHISYLYLGIISLQDIDCALCVDVQ